MIINANALNIPLADKSVQMIVTSPPYWGLRNYGVSGQLGLERTPEEYIANMVSVFRECWRVLRDDGTLWLNCGDSYARLPSRGKKFDGGTFVGSDTNGSRDDIRPEIPNGLKEKDLVGIPWRLAFALQADGWYLRSDIIWSKPNPMPESVTDRPTKSHEYLFLLTKSQRYYYDALSISEEGAGRENFGQGQVKCHDNHDRNDAGRLDMTIKGYRNRRSVWTIPTAPYKGAHFATFPPALVEPCIKAGTSERGACPKCGKGWRRVVEHKGYNLPEEDKTSKQIAAGVRISEKKNGKDFAEFRKQNPDIFLGWQPSCTCSPGGDAVYDPIPCLVFDPFVGSGTVVKVAFDLGRRGVGLDLSLEYLDEQARKRMHNGHTARLF